MIKKREKEKERERGRELKLILHDKYGRAHTE